MVYDEIRSEQELPIGWTDEQESGTYRLKKRSDKARFGYTVGPQSWKRYLFPPSTLLMTARRTPDGFSAEASTDQVSPYAFIGVRACDLNAIAIQSSTHALGLAEAVELSRTLGTLPDRVVVFGVEGRDFTAGLGVSPEVESALSTLIEEVILETKHC